MVDSEICFLSVLTDSLPFIRFTAFHSLVTENPKEYRYSAYDLQLLTAVSRNRNFRHEGGLVVEFSTIGGFLWLKDTAG